MENSLELNFNTIGNQQLNNTLIPKGSKVYVRLNIYYPKNHYVGISPELIRRASGINQLCVKLTVVKGTYKDNFFFHSFNIANPQHDGHIKAIEISKKQLRALIEANFMISPLDESESATNTRILKSFVELEGYVFPIVVGVELNSNGLEVNKISSIVTTLDEDFNILLTDGELLV